MFVFFFAILVRAELHQQKREQKLCWAILMIGPKGNREFCFPDTLNVLLGFALTHGTGTFSSNRKIISVGRYNNKLLVIANTSTCTFFIICGCIVLNLCIALPFPPSTLSYRYFYFTCFTGWHHYFLLLKLGMGAN